MNYNIRFREIDAFFQTAKKNMIDCAEHWRTIVKWAGDYAKKAGMDKRIIEYLFSKLENLEIFFGYRMSDGSLKKTSEGRTPNELLHRSNT